LSITHLAPSPGGRFRNWRAATWLGRLASCSLQDWGLEVRDGGKGVCATGGLEELTVRATHLVHPR
jgi:hypothetical protein